MSSSTLFISALKGFVFAFAATFLIQTLFKYLSPISPDILQLPPESSALNSPWNNHIQKVSKIGEGNLVQPEDLCFDKDGVLYTATRDGWIKKMHRNGSWVNWKMVGGDSILGIAMSSSKPGHLLVCDADKGLLEVSEERISILASHVNGSKITFADEVIEASDGIVYFSDPSTKFGFHDWFNDVLEAKPHGRLLVYNPSTKETSILIDDMCFPNGVALSKDQDFLVVCETWKFRCLKYWLKGEKKGTTEVFIDNLPGGPDNINLAPDGSFWIALLDMRSKQLNFVHTSKVAKHLLATFPKLAALVIGSSSKSVIVKVDMDGNIITMLDDSNGSVMSFVTSVVEFEDHIYLGSLGTNFIGKLPLSEVHIS